MSRADAGKGSASEVEELKAAVEGLRVELSNAKSQLTQRHGRVLGLEKQLSHLEAERGAQGETHAHEYKQLAKQLDESKVELARAKQELKSVGQKVQVAAEEESAVRLRQALNEAQKEAAAFLSKQKTGFEEQIAQLNKENAEALHVNQNEIENWKGKANGTQTKLAEQISENNELRNAITARDQVCLCD